MNINGLRGKTAALETAVEYIQPDVIMGCESKISDKVSNTELFPPGYQKDVFRKDRNDRGGGVFLAFKDGYVVSQIENSDTDCEAVWAEVAIPQQPPLQLCSFYRPPGSGAEPIKELSKAVSNINARGHKHVVVGGDFNCGNINWEIPTVTQNAREYDAHRELLQLTEEHSLTNIQHDVTRESSNLDIYLTTNPSLVKQHSVVPGLSDHEMVIIDSDIQPTFTPAPPRRVYSFQKADWDAVRKTTSEFVQKFLEVCSTRTVNENWEAIKSHLMDILREQIPSKMRSARRRLPWFNADIKRMIRRKKRLFKKHKKTKKASDWEAYKKYKKEVQRAIKTAHDNYINSILSDALEEGNHKPFWSYVKSKRKDAGGIAPLRSNGTLLSSSHEKAEVLSEQFSSVFTRDDTSPIPAMSGNPHPSMENLVVTENGVRKLLARLVTSKAPCPDAIPNTILKELATELAPALTSLYNQSITAGVVPVDWKKANISPIFKKDDKHQASNYRPVSLTCVCSKLLEHIIVSHLMNHLEKNHILTDLQHGFRQKRSCVTQLLETVSDLARYYDSNTQIDTCILDFSKAFDVVSHRKLAAKLHHYGVRDNTLAWIVDFLTGREQSVVVEGTSSRPAPVLSGVPQGTCLGPVLFLCYINDITQSIQSQLRLFADDALLYRPINSPEDHIIMQKDLDQLEAWAKSWNMNFNPKKCYVMSSKRSGSKSSHFYSLRGEVLQSVTTNPYLGVILSEDMKFTAHIDKVCSKASRTLGFISRNLKNCPQKLCETAYISLCRSTLEYACQIWDPHLVREIDQIERIQRKAARVVKSNYNQRSSVTEMMRELQWEPLADRRRKARFILLYHIIHGEVAVPIDQDLLQEGRQGRYKHLAYNHKGYQHSYYPGTIRDWNPLATDTKDSKSLEIFKSRLPTMSY